MSTEDSTTKTLDNTIKDDTIPEEQSSTGTIIIIISVLIFMIIIGYLIYTFLIKPKPDNKDGTGSSDKSKPCNTDCNNTTAKDSDGKSIDCSNICTGAQVCIPGTGCGNPTTDPVCTDGKCNNNCRCKENTTCTGLVTASNGTVTDGTCVRDATPTYYTCDNITCTKYKNNTPMESKGKKLVCKKFSDPNCVCSDDDETCTAPPIDPLSPSSDDTNMKMLVFEFPGLPTTASNGTKIPSSATVVSPQWGNPNRTIIGMKFSPTNRNILYALARDNDNVSEANIYSINLDLTTKFRVWTLLPTQCNFAVIKFDKDTFCDFTLVDEPYIADDLSKSDQFLILTIDGIYWGIEGSMPGSNVTDKKKCSFLNVDPTELRFGSPTLPVTDPKTSILFNPSSISCKSLNISDDYTSMKPINLQVHITILVSDTYTDYGGHGNLMIYNSNLAQCGNFCGIDSLAPGLKLKYGGGNWPSSLINQNAFKSAIMASKSRIGKGLDNGVLKDILYDTVTRGVGTLGKETGSSVGYSDSSNLATLKDLVTWNGDIQIYIPYPIGSDVNVGLDAYNTGHFVSVANTSAANASVLHLYYNIPPMVGNSLTIPTDALTFDKDALSGYKGIPSLLACSSKYVVIYFGKLNNT
jgi:hypothetical protein